MGCQENDDDEKKGVLSTPFFQSCILYTFDICGSFSLRKVCDFELDPVTFLKGPVAITDNILIVGKNVAATIFFLDEAISFSTIKPLYASEWHITPFKLLFVRGMRI